MRTNLSRERFTQPDPSGLTDDQIKHLLAWQKQRAELRQRMLGTAAASAWFDAEDGDCATSGAPRSARATIEAKLNSAKPKL